MKRAANMTGNERSPGRPASAGRALAVVAIEYEAEHPADDADEQGSEHSGKEAGDMEWQLELARHIAGQPEEQAVDHDADKSEGYRIGEAADSFRDRIQDGIDNSENQSY